MPDYGFIANPATVSPLNMVGQMLDMRQKMQTLESGDLALQAKRQANIERQALVNFMQTPDNFQTDGKIDLGKVNSAIPKIAPQTGSDLIAKLTTLGTAQTEAESAKVGLTQTERGYVGAVAGSMARAGISDPAKYAAALDQVAQQFGDSKSMQKLVGNYKTLLAATPPGDHVIKAATTLADQMLTPAQQQEALTPKAGLTSTGGELNETVTQPSVGGNAPSVSLTGRAAPLTLPPTATTVNAQNQPMYVGKPPGGGSTPAGPPLGAEASATTQASATTEHFKGVQAAAANASQDIGVLQEIKKYAPNAITGVGGDKRAMAAGIAGWLSSKVGMDVGQLSKTDTDLLAKNSTMLAAAGGSTDLARTLIEASNPNTKMTPQAIEKAANQIIAQRQLALERQKYLQGSLNNPTEYNAKASEFASIADPRILQLPTMSKADKLEMLNAMSPTEKAAFIAKTRQMQQKGILE